MLIRSKWTLSLSEPALIPRTYGLELIKDLHKRMNLSIGDQSIPNITASGIIGSCSLSGDFLTFNPDRFYTLTLCGLQEQASKAISSLNLSSSLEVWGSKFDIVNREDEISSYENLYYTLIASEPEPFKRFTLNFSSPTAFAQNTTYLPLPVPALMFRSWLERWNNFAPVYLGSDELIAYLIDAVALKSHNIKTRLFRVSNGYINGFIGGVTLQVLKNTEPLLANVANLLVNYAQFAGTGMKTRLGMGTTELNSIVQFTK